MTRKKFKRSAVLDFSSSINKLDFLVSSRKYVFLILIELLSICKLADKP